MNNHCAHPHSISLVPHRSKELRKLQSLCTSHKTSNNGLHIHVLNYIYIYMCACVCVWKRKGRHYRKLNRHFVIRKTSVKHINLIFHIVFPFSYYWILLHTLLIYGWLVVWILWHIKLCRLFNAKSIFIQIVLFQTIQFSMITQINYQNHFYFKLLSLVKQF